MRNPEYRWTVAIAIIVIIALVAYAVMTMEDRRTTTERVGDAVRELPQGPEKALREMEDRTPAEKLDDRMEDTQERMKENINP